MIPQSRPDLRPEDFAHVPRILKSQWIAQGPLVAQLERAFARRVRVKQAAATSSGTAALHLGLLALGIGPGDEVVVPSYACAAVFQAVRHAGATPRLVDIDGDTLNLTAAIVRRGLRKRTKALIVIHTLGYPAPMEELVGIGVPVVEDCALALGTTYHGRPVGTVGTLSVFSLYATKVICAGEGGMVCSDDPRIMERVRDLNGVDMREDLRLRYNYKLSDLAAGVALGQLRRLPKMLARRRAIAAQYRLAFEGCPVQVQRAILGGTPNYYRFLLRSAGAARIIADARRAGIGCDRPVFRPLHRYLDASDARDFPGSEAAFNSVVSVPIYPALSDRQVEQISQGMRRILGA